jgi:hypothetical protein
MGSVTVCSSGEKMESGWPKLGLVEGLLHARVAESTVSSSRLACEHDSGCGMAFSRSEMMRGNETTTLQQLGLVAKARRTVWEWRHVVWLPSDVRTIIIRTPQSD